MKSPKIKDKENFKSDKRKKFLTYKETPIRLPVDFSHIAGQERMKWFIQSAAKKKKKKSANLYPEKLKTLIWKDRWTLMFSAVLCTTDKYPLKDEWMKNTCSLCDTHIPPHTYIQWDISQPLKKERNIAICSNMDEPRVHHTKWRQRQVLYNTT